MVNVLDEPEEEYSLDARENKTLQSLVDEVADSSVLDDSPKALVELELKKQRILAAESHRSNPRVLFIASDEQLL